MQAQQLRNEIAIVTGSDSGIGRATAIAFAQEGAAVAVTYLHDKDGAEKTRREIESTGQKAIVVHLDQRDPHSVANLFQQAEEHLGCVSILVNDAGIDSAGKPVQDLSPEEWNNAIRTNLHGPFYCCREFISRRKGNERHASIINITSVHQEIPRAGAAGYDAAKGGLRNLTRTLALKLAEKNINVNNIAPGMVLTPFNQAAISDPEVREKQVQSIPMKRAAQPEEVADVAVFLASPRASYIHGSTVTVDGGLAQSMGQGA